MFSPVCELINEQMKFSEQNKLVEKTPESVLKTRIINRILKYSFIYEQQDLISLSLEELKKVQILILIPLILKSKYNTRHYK